MARWTKVVGVFTAVLSAVSFLTLLVIAWQSYTAWLAARDAREQTRALMQFLTVQSFAGPGADGEQIYGLAAVLQNVGSTRANVISGWDSVKYYAGSVPNNLDLSKPSEIVDAPKGIIAPNAQSTFIPVVLQASLVNSAAKKEGVILIWGRMVYTDIYDHTTEHLVTFCHRLTPSQTKDGLTSFAITPFRSDCNEPN
jgi:hypothetical protein